MSEIPVIDVARLADGTDVLNIAKQIHQACLEYGFFRVVNCGISTDLMAKVLGTTSQFFDLPLAIKRKIEKPRGKFRGYVQFSDESTSEKADWREGIYYFSEFKIFDAASRAEAQLSGKNPWPDEDLPEFRSTVAEYLEKATSLGYELMRAVAIGLGQEPDFFTKKYTNEPFVQFGLFHYPPRAPSGGCEDGEVFGVGEHTDYGNLIILLQDDVGGLQIQTKDGNWIDVAPVPGSLVVNIGDMLEVWTSGAYKATRHRVKTSTRDRISVVLFFDPSLECAVSPIPLEETTLPSCRAPTSLASQIEFPVDFGDYVLKKYAKSLQ